MNTFLSRQQAAEVLAVSEQTVDRLREAGLLESVKVGKRRVGISAESLSRYVGRITDRGHLNQESKR